MIITVFLLHYQTRYRETLPLDLTLHSTPLEMSSSQSNFFQEKSCQHGIHIYSLGPVQTSHFCRVEFNANEQKPLFELICIEIRRDKNATFELGLTFRDLFGSLDEM